MPDGSPLDDGVYKVEIKVYDRADNQLLSTDISNVYFIKDTDVPKVTTLRKYYLYSGVREDGWNIRDINDNRFNLQPAVYTDKDGTRRQKFRLYFTCQDTGSVSNKFFPERPDSKGKVYVEVENRKKIVYSGDINFSDCNNKRQIPI
jgi:hypothetical protein